MPLDPHHCTIHGKIEPKSRLGAFFGRQKGASKRSVPVRSNLQRTNALAKMARANRHHIPGYVWHIT